MKKKVRVVINGFKPENVIGVIKVKRIGTTID